MWTKVQIPKQYANNFIQKMEELKLHVKYKNRVIGRLISIEVL